MGCKRIEHSLCSFVQFLVGHTYQYFPHRTLCQSCESLLDFFERDDTVNLWMLSNGLQPVDNLLPCGLGGLSGMVSNRDTDHADTAEQQGRRIEFKDRARTPADDTDPFAIAEHGDNVGQQFATIAIDGQMTFFGLIAAETDLGRFLSSGSNTKSAPRAFNVVLFSASRDKPTTVRFIDLPSNTDATPTPPDAPVTRRTDLSGSATCYETIRCLLRPTAISLHS